MAAVPELSKEERTALAGGVRDFLREELDHEITPIEAEMLLAFLCRSLGPHFYNCGLHDAQAAVSGRLDEILEVVYGLEQPVDLIR